MDTPKFVMEYLNTLEQERERMGISIEELSKLSGVRKDILLAYEAGTGRPTPSKYNRLAEVFSWEVWQ